MRTTLGLALLLVLGGSVAAADKGAANHARTLAPYLDEGTLGVAVIDLSLVKVKDLAAWLVQLEPSLAPQVDQTSQAATAFLGMLNESGIRSVYFVLNFGDLPDAVPLIVMPVEEGKDAQKIGEALTAPGGPLTGLTAEANRGNLLLGTPRQMEQVKSRKPEARPSLAQALETAGENMVRATYLPSPFLRRAFKETMPAEGPGGIPIKSMLDSVEWASLSLTVSPKRQVKLMLHTPDEATAKSLTTQVSRVLEMVAATKEMREISPEMGRLLAQIKPRVQKSNVVMALDEAGITEVMTPAIQKIRSANARMISTNNQKQLGLAMHNYESAYRRFPPAASTDKTGKKLLSWRVHLLPFVEQEQLYRQFKLDEPWDSEHNKKLISKMPAIFVSPGTDAQLAAQGRTVYVVPTGAGTIFNGKEGSKIADIADGTSNTILLTEIADKEAVIWTKPDDLEIDPKSPAKGLKLRENSGFIATFADGSVRFIAKSIDAKTLYHLFLMADGQVINIP